MALGMEVACCGQATADEGEVPPFTAVPAALLFKEMHRTVSNCTRELESTSFMSFGTLQNTKISSVQVRCIAC